MAEAISAKLEARHPHIFADGSDGHTDQGERWESLKAKERHDCEATVLSGRPARDGSAILTVQLENGKTFDTLAPGSIDEKRAVLEQIASYIGRKLTIEYAHLTTDGIPFHAVATRWHEEL